MVKTLNTSQCNLVSQLPKLMVRRWSKLKQQNWQLVSYLNAKLAMMQILNLMKTLTRQSMKFMLSAQHLLLRHFKLPRTVSTNVSPTRRIALRSHITSKQINASSRTPRVNGALLLLLPLVKMKREPSLKINASTRATGEKSPICANQMSQIADRPLEAF